jgi:hypothetical protein
MPIPLQPGEGGGQSSGVMQGLEQNFPLALKK